MSDKKAIVILGAGFGGMKAVFELQKGLRRHNLLEQYEIFLVDRNSYHTYTPTLYEIATTSKETAGNLRLKEIAAFDIQELTGKIGINFIKAEIKELDLIGDNIHFTNGTDLKFQYLILALGSVVNYFAIPGMAERSLALKTFADALKIRDKITNLILDGQKNIKIVIGGGGTTGVEVAGELRGWIGELKKEAGQCNFEISVIEASPTILPGFDSKIISLAQKRLKNIGVKLILNEAIDHALPGKIITKSRMGVPYDILIWTGGTKSSPIVSRLPVKIERRGRIEVGAGMECLPAYGGARGDQGLPAGAGLPQAPDLKLSGKIYAIGDAVCCYDRSGKPIPGVAPVAIAQGEIAAKNIIADITGGLTQKYSPKKYPYIVPIGGKWAIAQLGPLTIHGFAGWILKGLVELKYLLSIMPLYKAVRVWLSGLIIFIKNDRLG
ncbi:MAG: FAD-dependent oxidoreductase [bacterium]|nr:FAD-dependent oxidoreductase [bacterium]